MGFNTVAVLYNDFTHEFRKSGRLGERIAYAMTGGWSERNRDSLATNFGAGIVISQAHADYTQIVAVGKNTGAPLSEARNLDQCAISELIECLERHGYRITKRRAKTSKGAIE